MSGTCVLCGREFSEWGNNPWPLAKGVCCNECDDCKVVPARLRAAGYSEKYAKNVAESLSRLRQKKGGAE